MRCGEQYYSCSCVLEQGHDDHLPHICGCGGAWDSHGLPVRWPRPEQVSQELRERVPMPAPGAQWRFDEKRCQFDRVDGDEVPAR